MVSGCFLLQVLLQLHESLVSIIIDLSYSETKFDKLNRLLRHNMIPTQMSLPFDCFVIDQLFRIQATTYWNGWKFPLQYIVQLMVKLKPIHKISYKLQPYMPCSIVVLRKSFTNPIHGIIAPLDAKLGLSNSSNWCHSQYYFLSTTFIHKNQHQSSHFTVHRTCAFLLIAQLLLRTDAIPSRSHFIYIYKLKQTHTFK